MYHSLFQMMLFLMITSIQNAESHLRGDKNDHICYFQIRRTHKFLVALALGKPIVEEYWLNKSKLSGFFIDPPDAYLLKDSEGESNYGFDLARSLKSHRTRPLLADKSFAIDPDFKSINENDLKGIYEFCLKFNAATG